MGKVMYCEKCGDIGYILFRKKCKNCGIKLKILSEEMKQKYNIFNDSWFEIVSQLHGFSNNTIIGTINEELVLREELISRTNDFVMCELAKDPVFSMKAYHYQIEKEREIDKELAEFHYKQSCEKFAKNIAQMQKDKDKQNCIPQCPTCGSTNVVKISLGKKAVGGALVGLYSSDIRNTMHCKNCGAKW